MSVSIDGIFVKVIFLEFCLIVYLVLNCDCVVLLIELLEWLYGDDDVCEVNVFEVIVVCLWCKLGLGIIGMWCGFGYYLE